MHRDYVFDDPVATSAEVLRVLQEQGIDSDGFSFYTWQKRLANSEVAIDLIEYVVENRANPSVSPMFDMIVAAIKEMLDE